MRPMGSGDVIRRKIRAADGRKPDDTVIEFAENLTAQIAEALLLEPKFTLNPRFVDAEVISFKSFLADAPQKSLFCYTEDVLFHLENQLAYAWIEKGLSGEHIDLVAADAYTPSAIDAALSQPLFECLLSSLQRDLPKQYRLAEQDFEQAMTIERLSDNVHFTDESAKLVSFKYGFSENAKQREFMCRILLHLSIVEEIILTVKPRARDDAPTSGLWTRHMQDELLDLPLKLTAVLGRPKMSVDEISHLAPGKHILLTRESLQNLTLGVETPRGVKILADGRLGSQNQSKAIKLNAAPKSTLASILKASLAASNRD